MWTVTTPFETPTRAAHAGLTGQVGTSGQYRGTGRLDPPRAPVARALAAARAAPAAATSARVAAAIFWPPSITRPAVMIMAATTTQMNTLTACPRSSRRNRPGRWCAPHSRPRYVSSADDPSARNVMLPGMPGRVRSANGTTQVTVVPTVAGVPTGTPKPPVSTLTER